MSDLKALIKNNLYLRVDFDNKYEKNKQNTDFFLIGKLPVFIFYKNGEQDVVSISNHIKVKQDPLLRKLQNIKATENKKIGNYKFKVKKIILNLEKALKKVIKAGEFNNKAINKILIVNLKSHEKRSINKN